MAHFTRAQIEEIITSADFQELMEIIASCKTRREVEALFRSAFSESELSHFCKRWVAIKYVNKGLPYHQIVKETRVPLATLSRARDKLSDDFYGWERFLEKSRGHTDDALAELFAIIASFERPDEVELFFRDGVTRLEMYKLRKRWVAVKMLERGVSYRQVARDAELSLATVLSLSGALRKGDWQLALDKWRGLEG